MSEEAKNNSDGNLGIKSEYDFYESFIRSHPETVLIILEDGLSKKIIYADTLEQHAIIVSSLMSFKMTTFGIGNKKIFACGYNAEKFEDKLEKRLQEYKIKYAKVSKSQNYKVISNYEPANNENHYNEELDNGIKYNRRVRKANEIKNKLDKLIRFDEADEILDKIEKILDETGRV